MSPAIGILELSSIAAGFVVQDTVIKAAKINLLIARTVCPGKYIVVIGGKVANVKISIQSGVKTGAGFIVDQVVIPKVDQKVFPALTGCVEIPKSYNKALGIIETFSAVTIIQAADAAIKAADVVLFRVHISMAIGGKGFLLLCGDVASVNTAVSAGVTNIKEEGMLANKAIITGASKELFKEYI